MTLMIALLKNGNPEFQRSVIEYFDHTPDPEMFVDVKTLFEYATIKVKSAALAMKSLTLNLDESPAYFFQLE